MFQRMLVASAASPRAVPVLAEAFRLASLYGAELAIVRVEARDAQAEERLRADARAAGWPEAPEHVVWATGDPARAILRAARARSSDLVIAGAVDREGLLTYYVGSVARKVAREAPCSVLLLTAPRKAPQPFQRVVVDTDFGTLAEKALRVAADLIRKEGRGSIHVVHDVLHPGLHMALTSSTSEEGDRARLHLREAREELMGAFLSQVGVRGVEVHTEVLVGRPGFTTAQFARQHGADLVVFPAPRGRSGVFDRLFPSEVEWILRDIPSALLLVR